MKTKITPKIILGIAGLLSGLVLAGGALTAYAAEPVTQPVNTVMNQTNMATLQNSLNTLQKLLDQLSSNLKNGQITATNAVAINVTLASTKENLLVLKSTLAILYPPSQNFAKSEISPAPASGAEAGLNIEPNLNVSAGVAPLKNDSGQPSLVSFLKSKTTIDVVLGIILLAVVAFSFRKKTKGTMEDTKTAAL